MRDKQFIHDGEARGREGARESERKTEIERGSDRVAKRKKETKRKVIKEREKGLHTWRKRRKGKREIVRWERREKKEKESRESIRHTPLFDMTHLHWK